MTRKSCCRIFSVLMVLMLVIGIVSEGRAAKDADAPEKAATQAKRTRPKGRLPAYYAAVVNERQRETIYAIQAEYQIKIEPLENQLKQLKQERDEKLAAVLTPEQRKIVEETAAARKSISKDKNAEQEKNAVTDKFQSSNPSP